MGTPMETLIVVVVGILVVLFVCIPTVRRSEAARLSFEKQFPPISEDEFIARCTPGIRPNVALAVRRIVADALCVDYERIYPSSRLAADLGAE